MWNFITLKSLYRLPCPHKALRQTESILSNKASQGFHHSKHFETIDFKNSGRLNDHWTDPRQHKKETILWIALNYHEISCTSVKQLNFHPALQIEHSHHFNQSFSNVFIQHLAWKKLLSIS